MKDYKKYIMTPNSSVSVSKNNLDIKENTGDIYLTQLCERERKAMEIAKNHLGTSFDVLKSNGYKEWLKNNK
jgi:hypothetical protein